MGFSTQLVEAIESQQCRFGQFTVVHRPCPAEPGQRLLKGTRKVFGDFQLFLRQRQIERLQNSVAQPAIAVSHAFLP